MLPLRQNGNTTGNKILPQKQTRPFFFFFFLINTLYIKKRESSKSVVAVVAVVAAKTIGLITYRNYIRKSRAFSNDQTPRIAIESGFIDPKSKFFRT